MNLPKGLDDVKNMLKGRGGKTKEPYTTQATSNNSFTAHNILLDNGVYTRPEANLPMSEEPWLKSAKRALELTLPGAKQEFSIVDLGCLEGEIGRASCRE